MKKIFAIVIILFLVGGILFFLYKYHGVEEKSNKAVGLLSKDEINIINAYRKKYENYPKPSDAEVLNVAKILLLAKPKDNEIEQLLGKPSDISYITDIEGKKVQMKCLGYDVGDSRRIKFKFDTSGKLMSIHGVGVGFDTLMNSTEHK